MKFRIYWSFVVFLGSYLPLCLILIVQDIKDEYFSLGIWKPGLKLVLPIVEHSNFLLAAFFVCFASFALLCQFMRKPTNQIKIKVVSVKAIPNDIINYVFPYVVSFMGLDLTDPRKILGFLLFLFWMFLITHKSGQILMNPLLLVLGWSLYEAEVITSGKTRTVRILSRIKLSANEEFASDKVQDFYLINNR
ncbi:hypothetical protein [Chitinibacter sp. S2-10]|uniref:hypothetical protein n=1 Tax=Chitinibacter sp. S2-10 TaxID=3373597 RepID=UPI00397731BE